MIVFKKHTNLYYVKVHLKMCTVRCALWGIGRMKSFCPTMHHGKVQEMKSKSEREFRFYLVTEIGKEAASTGGQVAQESLGS